METNKYTSDTAANQSVLELSLIREDEGGLVFLSCVDIPNLFIASKSSGEDLRKAIDSALKSAFYSNAKRVQVFTNGRLDGPSIDALVKITA
jgi:hypothetical protein